MTRPNKLDWLIYRFFRFWWNPILENNPAILLALADWLFNYISEHKDELYENSKTN